ncbi:chaperone modulatory protein CbpM [Pseudomonas pohangensis]|jgi:chaperone modulatory protein CbpM|uniref:Chaperone modulatory protein CbpM n=1 Tax=Pseudomonas pohangensis TaxID=364197 RepID=A0A1H2H0H2_9PSED|nr:chaperone modulator CbpM [Pseudomonas pohangensis]SDU25343.1 chaperone modulatory protein CbpM [Pseudomonas pohangensis]
MSSTYLQMNVLEFCQCTSLPQAWLVEIVEEGILQPRGASPEQWLFDEQALATARRALRLRQDLELEWAAIALALQLLDELEQLREENRQLRSRLGRFENG